MNLTDKFVAAFLTIAASLSISLPVQAQEQCQPSESDFAKFANMLTNVPNVAEIETKDFAAVFGDDDAANSLGLQRLTNKNGCFEATFITAGNVPCGTATLQYGTKVKFVLVQGANGVEMRNLKGLRGKEGMLNPTITDIVVSQEDLTSKQWTIHVTAKEMFVSATRDVVVKDDAIQG